MPSRAPISQGQCTPLRPVAEQRTLKASNVDGAPVFLCDWAHLDLQSGLYLLGLQSGRSFVSECSFQDSGFKAGFSFHYSLYMHDSNTESECAQELSEHWSVRMCAAEKTSLKCRTPGLSSSSTTLFSVV